MLRRICCGAIFLNFQTPPCNIVVKFQYVSNTLVSTRGVNLLFHDPALIFG